MGKAAEIVRWGHCVNSCVRICGSSDGGKGGGGTDIYGNWVLGASSAGG